MGGHRDDVIRAINEDLKRAWEAKGIKCPSQTLRQATAEEFRAAILDAKKHVSNAWMVDAHKISKYKNYLCLLTDDGKAGVAIKPNGEITSLFSNSEEKGMIRTLIPMAVAMGGRKLACYIVNNRDKNLAAFYSGFGFKLVGKTPFVEKYAEESFKPWKEKNPNKVPKYIGAMYFDGATADVVEKYDNSSVVDVDAAELFEDIKVGDEVEDGYTLMNASRDEKLYAALDRAAILEAKETAERAFKSDTRWSLIGKKGVKNLDDAARVLQNLEVAKSMMLSGKDAKTIKLATGWEYNKASGQWGYEIPMEFADIRFKPRLQKWIDFLEDYEKHEDEYVSQSTVEANKRFKTMRDDSKEELVSYVKKAIGMSEGDILSVKDAIKKVKEFIEEAKGDAWFYSKAYEPFASKAAAINAYNWYNRYDKDMRKYPVKGKKVMVGFPHNVALSSLFEVGDGSIFKAYPALGRLFTSVSESNGDSTLGGFTGDSLFIHFDGSIKVAKETLIHEIQHFIQHQEGWAEGANTSFMWNRVNSELNNRIQNARRKAEEIAKRIDPSLHMLEAVNYYMGMKLSPENYANADERIKHYEAKLDFGNKELVDAMNDWEKASNDKERLLRSGDTNFTLYRRAAGEVEARMAEYRLALPLSEQRETTFSDTLRERESNIKEEDQLIIRGGKLALSLDNEMREDAIANEFERMKEEGNAPNIRWAMEGSEGTLIALHNIYVEELEKSLALGGLPMPSIAVTKPSIPHDNYGDVSIVFGRETIDPDEHYANRVYSGDAWTPSFPQVGYKVDEDVMERVKTALRSFKGKIDDHFYNENGYYGLSQAIGTIEENFGDRGFDDQIKNYMSNNGLKAAFLESKGRHITPLKKEIKADKGYNERLVNAYQKIIDFCGVDALNEVKRYASSGIYAGEELLDIVKNKPEFEAHKEEILKIEEKVFETLGVKPHQLRALKPETKELPRLYYQAICYWLNKDKPETKEVIDFEETQKAVNDAITPLKDDYKQWLKDTFSGIVEKAGIRNNKDLFTRMGNRRSWEELHDEVTLDNVVRNMESQQETNGGFGGKDVLVSAQKTFDDVADIHKSEKLLRLMDDDERRELIKSLNSRVADIIHTRSDSFSSLDSAKTVLAEAVEKYGTNKKKLLAYIQKEMDGWATFYDSDIDELVDIVKEARKLPTGYFEAKPRRAVYFSEARAAFVPNTISQDLIDKLKAAGVPDVVSYNPNVEGSRHEAVEKYTQDHSEVRWAIGSKRKEQMRKGLKTKLANASDAKVEETIKAIEELGERVKAGGDPKTEKVAFHWAVQGTILLPEDEAKVLQAIKVAGIAKVDPMQYSSPMELIDAHANIKPKDARIDPDTVPELSNKQDLGHGITVYDVQDDVEGQWAMRQIINTHFGVDANPWCLLHGDGEGGLSDGSDGGYNAWHYWNVYTEFQKRVAFLNGKLIAFFASDNTDNPTWWDRKDEPHVGKIPFVGRIPNDKLKRVGTYEMDEETQELSEPVNIHKGDKSDGLYEEWYDLEHQKSREHFALNPDLDEDEFDEDADEGNKYLLHGECTYWHRNGNLESVSHRIYGKRDGLYESWYSNGVIDQRKNFKNGKLEGIFESYHENGNLKSRANYKDDDRDGEYTSWYENGQVKYHCTYKNGYEDGLSEEWYDNGRLKRQAFYKEEAFDGRVRTWWHDGNIKTSSFYVNDRKEGTCEEWYENGQIKTCCEYKGGYVHGIDEHWYENGHLKARCYGIDGKPEGLWEEWAEDGTLTKRENYKAGEKDGLCETWGRNGTLTTSAHFKRGKMIGEALKASPFGGFDVFNYDDEGCLHGVQKVKNDSRDFGVLDVTVNYKHGNLDGLLEKRNQDGKVVCRENYKDGLRHGTVETYSNLGDLVGVSEYKYGKLDGVYNGLNTEDGSVIYSDYFIDGEAVSEEEYYARRPNGVVDENGDAIAEDAYEIIIEVTGEGLTSSEKTAVRRTINNVLDEYKKKVGYHIAGLLENSRDLEVRDLIGADGLLPFPHEWRDTHGKDLSEVTSENVDDVRWAVYKDLVKFDEEFRLKTPFNAAKVYTRFKQSDNLPKLLNDSKDVMEFREAMGILFDKIYNALCDSNPKVSLAFVRHELCQAYDGDYNAYLQLLRSQGVKAECHPNMLTDECVEKFRVALARQLKYRRNKVLSSWNHSIATTFNRYLAIKSLTKFCKDNPCDVPLEPDHDAISAVLKDFSKIEAAKLPSYDFYEAYCAKKKEAELSYLAEQNQQVEVDAREQEGQLSGKWVVVRRASDAQARGVSADKQIERVRTLSQGTEWCTKSFGADKVIKEDDHDMWFFIPEGQDTATLAFVPVKEGEDLEDEPWYRGLFRRSNGAENEIDIDTQFAVKELAVKSEDAEVRNTLNQLGYDEDFEIDSQYQNVLSIIRDIEKGEYNESIEDVLIKDYNVDVRPITNRDNARIPGRFEFCYAIDSIKNLSGEMRTQLVDALLSMAERLYVPRTGSAIQIDLSKCKHLRYISTENYYSEFNGECNTLQYIYIQDDENRVVFNNAKLPNCMLYLNGRHNSYALNGDCVLHRIHGYKFEQCPARVNSTSELEDYFNGWGSSPSTNHADTTRWAIGSKRKEQMRKGLKTKLANASDAKVEATIKAIEELGERVKAGGDPKTEKVAFHWAVQGTILLPEDEAKVLQAIKVAGIAKVDPMQYSSPMELIDAHANIKPKDARIDPDTVPELSNKQDLGHGITVYDVQDDKEGQWAMRQIINTHFGVDANPWCLLHGDGEGGLSDGSDGGYDATYYWGNYNNIKKRVAFLNGKLIAFCASSSRELCWWDRKDEPHSGIPITGKIPNDPLGRSAMYELTPKDDGLQGEDDFCANGPDGDADPSGYEMSNPRNIHRGNENNGVYEKWYDDGETLGIRVHYKNGQKHGKYECWNENGVLIRQYNYADDHLVGECIDWYDNGQMRTKQTWDEQGRIHGEVFKWHENGQLFQHGYGNHGKPEGLCEKWDSNGRLEARKHFKDGKLNGLSEEWHNGVLIRRANYLNGEVHGLEEIWGYEGCLETRREMWHGKNHGICEKFYANGKIESHSEWAYGRAVGEYRRYDSNGNLNMLKKFYEDGSREERVYDNGRPDRFSRFDADGELDGEQLTYDQFGELQLKEVYSHGENVSSATYIFGQIIRENFYDSNGDLVRELYYNSDGLADEFLYEDDILIKRINHAEQKREAEDIRHSLERMDRPSKADMAVAFIAQQKLHGNIVPEEDVKKLLTSMGIDEAKSADYIERADRIAARGEKRATNRGINTAPEMMRMLKRAGMEDRYREALRNAVLGGTGAIDPNVGREVQDVINRHTQRQLDDAQGFTARQMMQELPISLADGVFAVADYERRKPKEENDEEETKIGEDELTDDEKALELESPVYIEPTEDERKLFEEIMDVAKAKAEKEAEEKKRADEAAAANNSDDEGAGGSDDETEAEPDLDAELPEATVRRIAPVFESPLKFAHFVIEWTARKIREAHPELKDNKEMWANPIAVKELIGTAKNILSDLAADVLGTPSVNTARNYADRNISKIGEFKTFNGVKAQIAYAYKRIHDDALRMSRKALCKEIDKALKSVVERGRQSSTKEDLKRKIDAATERWAKTIRKVMYMSEKKIAAEQMRLTTIVMQHETQDKIDGFDKSTDLKYREAVDYLNTLNAYGGMIRWMPSKIREAQAVIMEGINGKREEFERRRAERDARNEVIRKAVIEAVQASQNARVRDPNKRTLLDRANNLIGNIDLEMRDIIKYVKDPALRAAAEQAFEDLSVEINGATNLYTRIVCEGNLEVNQGLKVAYGNAEKGIKHLLTLIPESADKAIFKDRRNRHTYGQLLQLYASCLQEDYAENVKKFGRDKTLDLMKQTLTQHDMMFHAFVVKWNRDNRQVLSDAVYEVTGNEVLTPDRLYVRVAVDRPQSGFSQKSRVWSPISSALSHRVQHGYDFDESVGILDTVAEAIDARAESIAMSGAGILVRDTILSREVQEAVCQYVGAQEMTTVRQHLFDIFTQNSGSGGDPLKGVALARAWLARFYLSGNIVSASKQLASFPMWANEIGFGKTLKFFANAATAEGREAIKELMESDGYKARYMAGWSEEARLVLTNPSKRMVTRMIEKAYEKGMMPIQFMDAVCSLWIAQGVYREAIQTQLDRGFPIEEAKKRAATIAMAMVEKTQQSGKEEYKNPIQRGDNKHLGGLLYQFQTATLLQLSNEIQAFKDVANGVPHAKGRLIRTLAVNHVAIPVLAKLIEMFWEAIFGGEPFPEDEEKMPAWFRQFLGEALLAPVTPCLFLVATIKGVYGALTSDKEFKFNAGGQLPVEGIIRVGTNVGTAVIDLGKFGIQQADWFDFEEALEPEKVIDECVRAVGSLVAPVRQARKAYKNYTEDK